MYLLMIYCQARQREALLDELEDWKSEGTTILLSGISDKVSNGFIFMGWDKPIPDAFRQKLRSDPDILDFIAFGSPVSPPTLTIQPI